METLGLRLGGGTAINRVADNVISRLFNSHTCYITELDAGNRSTACHFSLFIYLGLFIYLTYVRILAR